MEREREARESLPGHDILLSALFRPDFCFVFVATLEKRELSTTSAPGTSTIIDEQPSKPAMEEDDGNDDSGSLFFPPGRVSFRFLATDAGLASSFPLPQLFSLNFSSSPPPLFFSLCIFRDGIECLTSRCWVRALYKFSRWFVQAG